MVSYATPYVITWSAVDTFMFFAIVNILLGIFLLFFMEESKNKTSFEIETLYWP